MGEGAPSPLRDQGGRWFRGSTVSSAPSERPEHKEPVQTADGRSWEVSAPRSCSPQGAAIALAEAGALGETPGSGGGSLCRAGRLWEGCRQLRGCLCTQRYGLSVTSHPSISCSESLILGLTSHQCNHSATCLFSSQSRSSNSTDSSSTTPNLQRQKSSRVVT